MSKYIRTEDGRIFDLEKFIEEEKESPYYTDYKFEEIKNGEDSCSIHWTAIGTKENTLNDQVGRRCQFCATIGSPFIAQAKAIEELIDRYVLNKIDIIFINKEHTKYRFEDSNEWFDITDTELRYGIHGAIWTDKGLIYVAKLNDKRKLELT